MGRPKKTLNVHEEMQQEIKLREKIIRKQLKDKMNEEVIQLMVQENKELTSYEFLVRKFVSDNIDLYNKLIERKPEDNNKQGPKKPPFAIARHKEVVYLSGINKVLLDKLVLNSKEKNHDKSKSDIVNEIFQSWMENDGTIGPKETEEPD